MNDATTDTTSANTTETETKKPRKVRTGPVLTKDSILLRAMQSHSVEEFTAKIAAGSPSRKLLKEAAKEAGDTVPAVLTDYLAKLGVNGASAARGRAAPKDGEKRTYSVQVLKDKVKAADGTVTEKGAGTPFLRLPLEILGVHKQDKVVVLFKTDRIVIKMKSAPAADANGPVEVIDAPAEEPAPVSPAAA